jgi:excisionase family DNA binding protein
VSAITKAILRDLAPDELAELASHLRPFLDRDRSNDLLTPTEAAQQLGVHVKTLTRAASAGRVPGAVKVGRGWRFRTDELAMKPPASVSTATAKLARPRASDTGTASAIRGRS